MLRKIDKILFPDAQKITEEVIQHYEKNPDELDLIINREYFNVLYLGIVFFIGILVTVVARVIQYFFGDELGDFINVVVLDVFSELGIGIFGGAVVAYLIEFLNKRQFQQNIKFRREIKSILDQRKVSK